MNPVENTSTPQTATQLAGAHQTEQRRRDEPTLRPPVDVIEDSTGITLFADLPGVSRDQLSLRVDGDQLHIEAGMSLPTPEGIRASHAEVHLARYARAFTLSKELDADQVSAELNQGVLKVRIPKTSNAQPRRIAVNVH